MQAQPCKQTFRLEFPDFTYRVVGTKLTASLQGFLHKIPAIMERFYTKFQNYGREKPIRCTLIISKNHQTWVFLRLIGGRGVRLSQLCYQLVAPLSCGYIFSYLYLLVKSIKQVEFSTGFISVISYFFLFISQFFLLKL